MTTWEEKTGKYPKPVKNENPISCYFNIKPVAILIMELQEHRD